MKRGLEKPIWLGKTREQRSLRSHVRARIHLSLNTSQRGIYEKNNNKDESQVSNKRYTNSLEAQRDTQGAG